MRTAILGFLSALCLSAQFVPTGQPIPKGGNPPVVFVPGYQSGCQPPFDFTSNFGSADMVLQTANRVSLFFDICTVKGDITIEALGLQFATFLASLKYDDGTPVTQVDVVAHSMGGLIVRSYLAGKQDSATAGFTPPASVPIRKTIMLSSPHFGVAAAAVLGSDQQTAEMSLGSRFLFDLNTWNQGGDDLRGVDALAISGNAGTGVASGTVPGYDDGLVAVVSSSLGFLRSGRTRLVPNCHSANALYALFGTCPATAPALNIMTDPNATVSKLVLSFLAGTSDWQSLGTAAEDSAVVSASGSLEMGARQADDTPLILTTGTYNFKALNLNSKATGGYLYSEQVPAGTALTLVASAGSQQVTDTRKLTGGTGSAVLLKAGPIVQRVIPAAAAVFPYSVAAGAFIGIYGTNLAGTTAAATQPYPTQLGDVQVTVNGTPLPLQFAGAGQINAIFPDLAPGLYRFTVKNAAGQHTVNLLAEAAVPAIFSSDASGTGAAAAVNALTGAVVTPSNPLRGGDYVSLYLTGLGQTKPISGFDYALVQPTVTVGGKVCNVTFAGRNPVYLGLDQINCQIPAGLAAGSQTVTVTSGTRVANSLTLPIQ